MIERKKSNSPEKHAVRIQSAARSMLRRPTDPISLRKIKPSNHYLGRNRQSYSAKELLKWLEIQQEIEQIRKLPLTLIVVTDQNMENIKKKAITFYDYKKRYNALNKMYIAQKNVMKRNLVEKAKRRFGKNKSKYCNMKLNNILYEVRRNPERILDKKFISDEDRDFLNPAVFTPSELNIISQIIESQMRIDRNTLIQHLKKVPRHVLERHLPKILNSGVLGDHDLNDWID